MKWSPTGPELFEVTLRDGSYLIDFQFTASDTATIAAALESVGVRWIELGHGLGMNASEKGHGRAAATDAEYLEAAAGAIQEARWGMFFIPGIGREEDLRLAARHNMSFVRIGTNITEIESARRYFELARELGFITTWNGMKSYAVTPAEFGRKVAQVRSWGVDVAYLVDSAGGMYPEDVSAYLQAARGECDIALGYHGHDNLSLAMANTLRAIECGAVLIDTSLQGMGRSAGNAITEVLVAIMKKRGLWQSIDLNGLMDIGQGLIKPLIRRSGVDPMAVTAGYARFHSSFTEKVQAYARKHNLDVRDLIVRLCQEDQVSAPDGLLERLSLELASERMPRVISIPVFGLNRPRPASSQEALRAMLKQLRPCAVKAGKHAAVNIAIAEAPLPDFHVSGNIQDTLAHIVAPVDVSTEAQLLDVLKTVEGAVDVVLLDVDRKPFGPSDPATTGRQVLKDTLLLTYSDGQVWISAVEDQVVRLADEALAGVPIVIAGDHPRARRLALRLAQRRASVTMLVEPGIQSPLDSATLSDSLFGVSEEGPICCLPYDSAEGEGSLGAARLAIVWPRTRPWFGLKHASRLRKGAYLVDAGVGSVLPDALARAQENGVLSVRVNLWPALSGALVAAHESARVCRESFGWGSLAGVDVVAGGALGRAGSVVVDSVRHPRRVIGIADGRGGISFDYQDLELERVRSVSAEIQRQRLASSAGG
jgi:4-hydroxy-2-oxovalerate aldolase